MHIFYLLRERPKQSKNENKIGATPKKSTVILFFFSSVAQNLPLVANLRMLSPWSQHLIFCHHTFKIPQYVALFSSEHGSFGFVHNL